MITGLTIQDQQNDKFAVTLHKGAIDNWILNIQEEGLEGNHIGIDLTKNQWEHLINIFVGKMNNASDLQP